MDWNKIAKDTSKANHGLSNEFGSYNYRDFKIPKKNGKFRKLSAPNKELLKFQRKQLNGLYEYYFKEIKGKVIENVAHGFLPQRNVVTAAEKHIGFKCTIMMDISNFFDSITKDMLPIQVHDENFFHRDGDYCAQGFATSPMLANIASIGVLKAINKRLSTKFKKEFAFTIYADDIQISLNSEDIEDHRWVIDIVRTILKMNKLELNETKTRTKYAKYGFRRILGINVGDTKVQATRATMRKIRAAKHQNNKSSLGGLTSWSHCNKPNPANVERKKAKIEAYRAKKMVGEPTPIWEVSKSFHVDERGMPEVKYNKVRVENTHIVEPCSI